MNPISSRIQGEGLTYDDVLLVPAFSEVLPRDVDIRTHLTKNIVLNIPMLSAAMDTVTEAGLAIALAREGGLGILHKNMSIERQAEQVRKVKRSESGMIIDPITLLVDATIGDALYLMKENKIGGIPVVDNKFISIFPAMINPSWITRGWYDIEIVGIKYFQDLLNKKIFLFIEKNSCLMLPSSGVNIFYEDQNFVIIDTNLSVISQLINGKFSDKSLKIIMASFKNSNCR